MNDDDENGSGQDKAMPLRDNKHEVEIVHMPGDPHPVLGYTYGPDEVELRLRSNLYWNEGARSPRSTADSDAAPVRSELGVRQRTILSYKLSEPERARVNRMQTEGTNRGRKEPQDAVGRIDVKIRD